jgi:hypothetical protein
MHEPVTPSPAPPPRLYQPHVFGLLARLAVGLSFFFGTLALLGTVAAPAGGSSIGGKLEYWRAHGAEYDTVFLGSSHVLRAFVPAEFDRAAARFGLESRSFNFGVQAVNLLEQCYLLEEILAAGPRVRRVLFEYQWLMPQIDPTNAFNPRTVSWHDADTTRLALERARHWGAALGDELAFVEGDSERHSLLTVFDRLLPAEERMAEQHLQHYLTRVLQIGRGKDVLRGLLGRETAGTERLRAEHGYVSLEDDERQLATKGEVQNSYRVRRERFLAEPEAFQRAVDELDAAEESFGDGEWMNGALARIDDFELTAQIARSVAERGIEFVLVIMPSQSANRPFEERLAAELGATVLRYNLPERYPDLYDPAKRWDSGHLSAEGARELSFLLARDLAGQVREGSP